jgi:DNA-binding beta-propeller fold protein YncE
MSRSQKLLIFRREDLMRHRSHQRRTNVHHKSNMTNKTITTIRIFASLTLVLSLASGCATKKPAPKNFIVFPAPPEEPRIQYLMSYGSETELGEGSRFANFVVGEEKVYRPIWKPYGLTIRDGKIFVCDTQAGNVSVADLATRKMRALKPQGLAAMKTPVNVAVDKDGTVYVTDTGREQVLIYDKQGSLLEALGKKDEMKPCGIALAGDRLYVTDLKAHNIRVYNKASRQLLFTFPKDAKDAKASVFQPTNVAVDPNGRVCVADTGGFCVKVYDRDGNFLRSFGDLGVTPGQFTLPKGVGVDREGRIYVVDAAAAVVQLFDAEGRLLMFFGEPKSSGDAGLYLPAAITIDYDNVRFFQKYLAPGYKLEYVILLTNQVGPHKVSAFGFIKKA